MEEERKNALEVGKEEKEENKTSAKEESRRSLIFYSPQSSALVSRTPFYVIKARDYFIMHS